ncbi:MAG: hypothetical protein FWC27_11240 [Firmicutes bacterium]|nr:hypothetical protein [Bacillota bacterium]
MAKRNIFLRIAVLMLIAVLATSGVFVGSGTYAKYIAAANVEASARVAKFDVKVNGTTFSSATAAAVTVTGSLGSVFELFNDGDDSNLNYPATSGGTGNGNGRVSDQAENANPSTLKHLDNITGTLICPGIGGKISVLFKNDSEVAVRFWLDTATVTHIGNNTNDISTATIQFSHENKTASFTTLAAAITAAKGSLAYIDLVPGETASAPIDLWWRWRFSTNGTQDDDDTKLGVLAAKYTGADETASGTSSGTPGLKLTLAVKAQQID